MEENVRQPFTGAERSLLRYGIALFLLGLISGLVLPALANPRMGLSAHLEGVLNGIYLMALGLIWSHLRLGPRTRQVARRAALYGTFVNWATTELAAVFGTSRMTPIAGSGYTGEPWQENFVMVLLITVVITMIGSSALVLWGLRGRQDAA